MSMQRVIIAFLGCCFLMSCFSNQETIKIKGSDTEVNLAVQLAEAFREERNDMFISISGGGSGLGIASLLNGTADIANSSRRIKQSELDLFSKKNIQLDSFIFAEDAIAFVVSDSIPINTITVQNLKGILSGQISNWNEITTLDRAINIYGRQSNSGTHEFIKKKMNIEFSSRSKEMNGNAQILEAIKFDNSGIGYVGAGYVTGFLNSGFKVLSIQENDSSEAISPLDESKILQHAYYFQRPLYQYYKVESYAKIKRLLDFEKGTTGLRIIKEAGYYPIKN
jgi:phosphate transport system substrate-binding protein